MDLFTPYIIWNIIVTLVLGPLWLSIRKNETELKRQDILLNKTREELAKGYVTKPELKNEMDTFVGHYLALTYQSKSGGEGSRSELATLRSAALQLRRRLPPLRRFGIRAG